MAKNRNNYYGIFSYDFPMIFLLYSLARILLLLSCGTSFNSGRLQLPIFNCRYPLMGLLKVSFKTVQEYFLTVERENSDSNSSQSCQKIVQLIPWNQTFFLDQRKICRFSGFFCLFFFLMQIRNTKENIICMPFKSCKPSKYFVNSM